MIRLTGRDAPTKRNKQESSYWVPDPKHAFVEEPLLPAPDQSPSASATDVDATHLKLLAELEKKRSEAETSSKLEVDTLLEAQADEMPPVELSLIHI